MELAFLFLFLCSQVVNNIVALHVLNQTLHMHYYLKGILYKN